MPGLELLSPAGSYECVAAAVLNGADAVYMGFGDYNARRNAKNFTDEEFREAVRYCHVRGVLVYLTFNTLLSDRELEEGAQSVRLANRLGVDAVIVQDPGVLRMVRMVAPDMAVHASTQMGIHSLDGVRFAGSLGATRAVLARELNRKQIEYIASNSPIEIEVFAHGALCVSYSGMCYMSSLIGRRSGNRGLCAGPCRLPYGWNGAADANPLSLKDLSLAKHLSELREMGVKCVKIEGRMKRPEYVALVTRVYSAAIKEERAPTPEELRALEGAFSRQGFTDGYYENDTGAHMYGVREEHEGEHKLFASARQSYKEGAEIMRVPVNFRCFIQNGVPMQLAVTDSEGRTLKVSGDPPERARAHASNEAEIRTQLYKTGGTPYHCESAEVRMAPGLNVALGAVNSMRRAALDGLTELRKKPSRRTEGEFKPGVKYLDRREQPVVIVSVSRAAQITAGLCELSPALLYVPVVEYADHHEFLGKLAGAGIPIAVSLPPVLHDDEYDDIRALLRRAKECGVEDALCAHPGQLALVNSEGFGARADHGFNVFNSQTLKEYRREGLKSVTLSFELNLAQIRDMSMCMDAELIVYGRLPLMVLRSCIIRQRTGRHACENINELTDRAWAHFPVVPSYNCRNIVLNSQKVFMGDKREDYSKLGLWAARLNFTTENPLECVQVTERYLGRGKYEPNGYTRGLYYRGAE